MTIDEAIATLTKMRASSSLGGETCLAVCLVGSGIADSDINSLALDQSPDGAIVYVMVTDHDMNGVTS